MIRCVDRLLRQWMLGLERAGGVPREEGGIVRSIWPFSVVAKALLRFKPRPKER